MKNRSTISERIGDLILEIIIDGDDAALAIVPSLVEAYRGAAVGEAENLEKDLPPELFGDAAERAMLDSYIAAYRKEDSKVSKESILEYFEWPDTLPNDDEFPIPADLIRAIGVQMARRDAADARHLRSARQLLVDRGR